MNFTAFLDAVISNIKYFYVIISYFLKKISGGKNKKCQYKKIKGLVENECIMTNLSRIVSVRLSCSAPRGGTLSPGTCLALTYSRTISNSARLAADDSGWARRPRAGLPSENILALFVPITLAGPTRFIVYSKCILCFLKKKLFFFILKMS